MLSYLLWWPLLRGWHSQTAYVHAIMIPYSNCIWLSCILTQHTTVCITIMPEWIDYCSSTHSQTDMYHNSWTPPIPACNGDTCRPHPCLLMCYQLLIRYDVIHRSSRTVILFKLLNERLSCTKMYITDEALVEHSVSYLVQKCTLQILYINVHNRSRPRCINQGVLLYLLSC